jgi:hypothetical protein
MIDLTNGLASALLTAIVLPLASGPAAAEPSSPNMPLGTNFWSIDWHRADDVFRDGRENVRGDNPWNSKFIKQLEPYTLLRFMDWGKVNNAERTSFDQRKLPDNPDQSPIVAYEWMIDLCNRTGKDMWVCIPHQADYAYSTQLAELIAEQLDPTLALYVEYSNETWNGMFKQFHYCIEQGQRLNLPGVGMKPGENKWYVGWAYHVYAAVRHFERFDAVFADAPEGRLIKVLAGFAGNPACTEHHLAVLEHEAVNPNGVEIDAYALAPYFGHEIDGAREDVFAALRTDLHERVVPKMQKHRAYIDAHGGLSLIAYEGGQHVHQNADRVNYAPPMYDLYREYLNTMAQYFDGVFAHYVHVGANPPRHMWGALRYTGQSPADAPKYRALLDYAADTK